MADETSIIASAQGLFHRFGIRSVTMDDVAHHLGISKKTLYCAAQNKDALVEKTVGRFISQKKGAIKQICERQAAPLPELFSMMGYIACTLGEVSEAMVHDLQKYHHDSWQQLLDFYYQYLFEKIKTNLVKGAASGDYRADMKPEFAAMLLLQVLRLFLRKELPQFNSSGDFVKNCLDFFLVGMATEQGREVCRAYLEQ
mgnify:FL=1|jgi:AcrR family transcriptional regulator